ncbi:hypothetical protein GF312_12675 [Candidatus Poribacteria bacterium]|nr:hypothetical protein [Candidatus Poribacteria bacterium]
MNRWVKDIDSNWKNARPRLFFTSKRIERFRDHIKRQGKLREAWLKLIQRAEGLLEAEFVPEEYAEKGSGQHGNYGRPSSQVRDIGGTLGLVYHITGDKRYAEKLQETLFYYGNYRRWCGLQFTTWDPPWHSELNTARFCYGYAVGYDCIYDFLSPEDRVRIGDSMIRLGILPTLEDWLLPENRVHALDSMGHNWWSVCVAMAGLAVLSILGDEPRAKGWISRISRGFSQWFYYEGNVLQSKPKNFDREGAFYESVNYTNYALSEYLLYRLAWVNTFPDSSPPRIDLLDKAGGFFLHTCYPTSDGLLSVNFGDSGVESDGSRTISMLLANGYDNEQYRWYLERTHPDLRDPVALVYCEPEAEVSSPKDWPRSVIYTDIGWGSMRSSWEDDATFLAVKSGFTWNHAHADAGSFILLHKGKPLIIDSGSCSYSRPEYTRYYCQSQAHNVILFNGQGQSREDIPRGVKTSGTLHHLMDMDGLKYIFADATGPMSHHLSRNYRHFLWLGGVILVIDDLRAHSEGRFDWLLHYEGEAQIHDSKICLDNGQAKAIIHTMFPEASIIVEKEGLKDHRPNEKTSYFSLQTRGNVRDMKFITAIVPGEKDANMPYIEGIQSSEMIGVRIHENGMVSDVYLNLRADGRRMHRNSNNSFFGWETDAYLMATTRLKDGDEKDPDSVLRYFVACGSYLRRDKRVILDSLSKVYAACTMGQSEMDIILQGQPLMEVELGVPQKPEKVRLNCQNVDVDYNDATKSVKLTV